MDFIAAVPSNFVVRHARNHNNGGDHGRKKENALTHSGANPKLTEKKEQPIFRNGHPEI